MNRIRNTQQNGFTIIELSLSMAFIAMLLLSISMLTIQINTLYNKGLTMRAVNESGALIMRDMQQSLNSSIPGNVLYVEEPNTGGRLCTNGAVYAWNYGGHTSSGNYGFYGRNSLSSGSEVRLLRLAGSDSYCKPDGGVYPLLPATGEYTALLKPGDNTLALNSFALPNGSDGKRGEPVKDDNTQRMYRVTFALGTEDGKYITTNNCQAADSSVQNATDDSYCAVNIFTFTARAGNRNSDGG